MYVHTQKSKSGVITDKGNARKGPVFRKRKVWRWRWDLNEGTSSNLVGVEVFKQLFFLSKAHYFYFYGIGPDPRRRLRKRIHTRTDAPWRNHVPSSLRANALYPGPSRVHISSFAFELLHACLVLYAHSLFYSIIYCFIADSHPLARPPTLVCFSYANLTLPSSFKFLLSVLFSRLCYLPDSLYKCSSCSSLETVPRIVFDVSFRIRFASIPCTGAGDWRRAFIYMYYNHITIDESCHFTCFARVRTWRFQTPPR
jgi:hypothetical protein